MEAYNGTQYVAEYSTFTVGSQADEYVLTLDGFSSTPSFHDDLGARAMASNSLQKTKIKIVLILTVLLSMEAVGGTISAFHSNLPDNITKEIMFMLKEFTGSPLQDSVIPSKKHP